MYAKKLPYKKWYEYAVRQRVHSNFNEQIFIMLVLLLVGGITYPQLCTGLAVSYLVGRTAYTIGYLRYPKGRAPGLILMNFSTLPLMVIAVMSAMNLGKDVTAGAPGAEGAANATQTDL